MTHKKEKWRKKEKERQRRVKKGEEKIGKRRKWEKKEEKGRKSYACKKKQRRLLEKS